MSTMENTDLRCYLDNMLANAREALTVLETYSQEQVDSMCRACAKTVYDHAEELAKDAVEETRMGIYEDKVIKNRGKARAIWWSLKGKKSVGVIDVDEASGITKIAKPVGVVGAITPTTNPIVTCMSNAMFALKCRNPIIIAPHPRAMGCCIRTVELMNEALTELGAPVHAIQIFDIKSLDLTKMLMSSVDVVIATGGMDMVRSVYSSGTPALGVGAGNVQALVDTDADLEKALGEIIEGRGFDNGILCTCEQTIHLPEEKLDEALNILKNIAFVADKPQTDAVREFLFPNGKMNRKMVGQSAQKIGAGCGVEVPADKKVIVLPADGPDDILGEEKMYPVIALMTYRGWQEGIEHVRGNLAKIGRGHSIVIHSNNREHILEAASRCEVSRAACNQVGATNIGGSFKNGLNPTNTLGCGSWGNNSISENLTYYHLMNITRVADALDGLAPADEEIWDA